MIDFLKSFYRRKSNSADPLEKRGYEVAQRARTNPFVRAYLDKLATQYNRDQRELDLKYAAYFLTSELVSSGEMDELATALSIDNSEDNIEEYARLVGVPDDLIIKARDDHDARALMRVHTRLGIEDRHVGVFAVQATDTTNDVQIEGQNTMDFTIIDEREVEDDYATWTEYLVVKTDSNSAAVTIERREILGTVDDYIIYDDDGNRASEIPAKIGGNAVWGEEYGLILGHEFNANETVTLFETNSDETISLISLAETLRDAEWDENLAAKIFDIWMNEGFGGNGSNRDTTRDHQITNEPNSSLEWRVFLESLPETLGFEDTHLLFQRSESGIRDYGNGSGSQTFHAENGKWTIYAWNLDDTPLDDNEREYATKEILQGEVQGLKLLGMDVNYNGAVLQLPMTDANQNPMHMGLVSWNRSSLSHHDEALALIIIRDLVIKLRGSIPDIDGAHLQFITVVSSTIALHSSHN